MRMKILGSITIGMLILITFGKLSNFSILDEFNKKLNLLIYGEKKLTTQLMIYLEPPVFERGGTVIVAANKIPIEEWEKIPDSEKIYGDKATILKQKRLDENDKVFAVTISSKVNIIEIVYPEGGTYKFSLLSSGEFSQYNHKIKTRRISYGSGGEYIDKVTNEIVSWEDVSTIHIYGSGIDEGFSRGVGIFSGEFAEESYPPKEFNGGKQFTPSPLIIKKIEKKWTDIS